MIKLVRRTDPTLVILIVLLSVAVGLAFLKGGGQLAWLGVVQAGRLLETVWLRLPLGFALGGLIQVLVPRAVIARWLGPASGVKGILIGSYTGIILSGAPYVMLPVVASLYLAGAGAGPIIALLTGQALLALQNLIVWQIPFLGVGLPLSKYIVCLFIVPLVGLAGSAVFKLLGRLPDLEAKRDLSASGAGQKEGADKT
ncbi:MAG: permease [Chloroflexi bacterium]|nr:permease [Chloroflexota bacterium]